MDWWVTEHILLFQNIETDSTHCMGRYHCTDGLQFDWFGFSRFSTYKTTYFLASSNPIQLNWRPGVQWSFPLWWVLSDWHLISPVWHMVFLWCIWCSSLRSIDEWPHDGILNRRTFWFRRGRAISRNQSWLKFKLTLVSKLSKLSCSWGEMSNLCFSLNTIWPIVGR